MLERITYVQAIFVRQYSNSIIGFKKYIFKTKIDEEILRDICYKRLLIKDKRYSNYIQIVGFLGETQGKQKEAELSFEGIKLVDFMIEYATESAKEMHKSYINLGREDVEDIRPIPMRERVQNQFEKVEQQEVKKSTTRKFIKY